MTEENQGLEIETEAEDIAPDEESIDPAAARLAKLELDLANARKEAIAAKKEASTLKKSMTAYEGVDLQEVARLKAIEIDRQQKDLEARGEYTKSLENFRTQTKLAEEKAAAAEARASRAAVDSALTLEFIKAGGNKDHLPLFLRTVDGVQMVDGAITYPTRLDESGEELSSLGQYVAHLREKTSLGLFFEPLNQARGSGDRGGKVPAAKTPRTIKASDAGAYIEQIAAGEVEVID
jgi:hypothetical protein